MPRNLDADVGSDGGAEGAAEGALEASVLRAVAADGGGLEVAGSIEFGAQRWVVWRVVWHVANHTGGQRLLDCRVWGRQLLSRRSRTRLGGKQDGQGGGFGDVGRAVSRVQERRCDASLSVIVPVTNSGAPRWSVWACNTIAGWAASKRNSRRRR